GVANRPAIFRATRSWRAQGRRASPGGRQRIPRAVRGRPARSRGGQPPEPSGPRGARDTGRSVCGAAGLALSGIPGASETTGQKTSCRSPPLRGIPSRQLRDRGGVTDRLEGATAPDVAPPEGGAFPCRTEVERLAQQL